MTLQAKANIGTGTDNLDTDLIGGVHTGVSKLKMGGTGVDEGTVASDNPMPVHPVNSIGQSLVGGSGGVLIEGPVEVTQLNHLGAPVSSTNGLSVEIVEGKGTQTSNPIYATIVDNTGSIIAASGSLVVSGGTSVLKAGNPVSPTNAIETTIRDASGTNVATGGRINIQAPDPLPTAVPVIPLVTQTAVSALNTNLFTGVAGVTDWYDVGNAAEILLHLKGSAGISAGGVTLEGTNDTSSSFAFPLNYVRVGVIPPATEVAEVRVAANEQVALKVVVSTRFVRARISTAFVGGTLSALINITATSSVSTAQEVVLPSITNTTGLSALNTNALTGVVSTTDWVDTRGSAEIVYQIIASAGISAGQVILEGTNDNTQTTGFALLLEEPNVIAARTNAAIAIAANANRLFRAQTSARYVRLRISTAFVGGTIGVRMFLKHGAAVDPNVYPVNATIQGTPSVNVASVIQTVASGPLEVSASRLVSGTGSTLTQNNARGLYISHNISVLSGGTAPTVQLRLQVIDPVSSVWADVPGVTIPVRNAVGLFTTVVYPGLSAGAEVINMAIPRQFRFAWTITGAPTGCTFSIGGNYII